MQDPRIGKLARLLVNYSIRLKPGENVYLLTDSELGLPLAREVYKEIIIKGGHPYPHLVLDPNVGMGAMDPIFMRYAIADQLSHLSDIALREMQEMDAYIRIGAPENTKDLAGIDPERIVARERATQPILDERLRKRWVVTRYPTPALAQEAGMSISDYEDFLYGACLVNYRRMKREQGVIKERFDNGRLVRIVAPGTDLTFSISGRRGIMCYGLRNVPDGEVYYAPVEDSMNGVVSFPYPTIVDGQEVDGVVLEFENGRVVKASASKNEKLLIAKLDTDKGARVVGEFGIGTNYGITRYTKNTLFDEKIGGTIHLALGNAYEGSAPKDVRNKSAIHWDMVVDLREFTGGGKIYLDRRIVQRNGVFRIE